MSNFSLPDTLSLVGKTAIVTGASRGIGAGIALLLAERGADVHVHYGNSEKAADEVVAKIQKLGRKADKIQSDLASKECGNEIAAGIKASSFGNGRVDVIIHNAAINIDNQLADMVMDNDFTHQMNVNVRSVLLITQALLPVLNNPSRIVIISSVSARMALPAQVCYGGSKAFLEHTARVWSKELGGHSKHGATVNCVSPGPVATDIWNEIPEEFRKSLKIEETTYAEGRFGEVGDITEIVAFLCSEGARWITGSTVSANGGMIGM